MARATIPPRRKEYPSFPVRNPLVRSTLLPFEIGAELLRHSRVAGHAAPRSGESSAPCVLRQTETRRVFRPKTELVTRLCLLSRILSSACHRPPNFRLESGRLFNVNRSSPRCTYWFPARLQCLGINRAREMPIEVFWERSYRPVSGLATRPSGRMGHQSGQYPNHVRINEIRPGESSHGTPLKAPPCVPEVARHPQVGLGLGAPSGARSSRRGRSWKAAIPIGDVFHPNWFEEAIRRPRLEPTSALLCGSPVEARSRVRPKCQTLTRRAAVRGTVPRIRLDIAEHRSGLAYSGAGSWKKKKNKHVISADCRSRGRVANPDYTGLGPTRLQDPSASTV